LNNRCHWLAGVATARPANTGEETDMIRWWARAACVAVALLPPLHVFSQELRVGIREDLAFVDVLHEGRKVRIQRIQDVQHRLVDNWARTSRPCPPACLQPLVPASGVQPVAELETLDFLQQHVNAGTGMLIDARPPELYRLETIPAALNVPASVLRAEQPRKDAVLQALGGRLHQGRWDFAGAAELLLFCNGAWSDDSGRAVKALVALGYPPGKLRYYRGGLHSWLSLGMTTVVPTRVP
jgi:rhodanese-related sulfurtransferase